MAAVTMAAVAMADAEGTALDVPKPQSATPQPFTSGIILCAPDSLLTNVSQID